MPQTLADAELDALWAEWRADRSASARERLICHYLPLVEFLAAHIGRYVEPSTRADLYGFGVFGLMDAIDKYRPDEGARFETYGSRRIRGAMSDGLRKLDWLPRGAQHRTSRVIEKIVPVDFHSTGDARGVPLDDSLFDPLDATPIDALVLEDDHAEVADAVETLPERERTVVTLYYYERLSLAEVGRRLGVTESRACQLHRRALRLLEAALAARASA